MKLLIRSVLLVLLISTIGCKHDNEMQEIEDAESIISNAYDASGVVKLENATMSFKFRDKYYRAERKNGKYSLERSFHDSIGMIKDVLTNDNFQRLVDDNLIEIPDSMAIRYTESVNSVHYFSVLPFGLKDKAVNATLLDSVIIQKKTYNKIKVTFDQEGGGVDFEDKFIYWIDKKTNYLDYMAYSFTVNGGGMRFREAFNQRFINGVRIVDYNNYKPKSNNLDLSDLDAAFKTNNLELLSKIELEDVTIN